MGATFSLGRLAGIRIGVHWSVLVIFVLIAVGLAAGRLPDTHPDRPAWLYAVVGVATAVVFLLSLLVHELSHAIVARRNGVGSDDITLWLLGGAARLKSEAPSPAAELRIAGIGPLVSLALGVVFALLTVLFGQVYGSGLWVEALAWLAAINVLLAVFNALPAAPLDGGRLLRALVWWRTGSRLRATEVATTAGRVLGWLLIAAGVYLAFAGAAVDGLWLMLIGWFMIAMATAEGGQAKMRELLGSVPVRRAMTPDPTTVPAATTIREFLSGPPWVYRHSAFPVVDAAGRPTGLISVNRAGQVPVSERDRTTVAAVMVSLDDLPTAHPDDRLIDLLPSVDTSAARRALVLSEDRLVGIVTQCDISRVINWLTSASSMDGNRVQPSG
ncbi:site-2 protease family protein [Streptomyces sp. SA15]|uniref:site-2 protease family protein n=1 Tax=Streptomyces sp. SA15 TaxID=934019 RepID=UPI000BAF5DB6|nr:site-2 protease family protein [Streptomyces sp. SA15]PAZ15068.1 site-2 protease family protein [Streptomyces sp. SA15]